MSKRGLQSRAGGQAQAMKWFAAFAIAALILFGGIAVGVVMRRPNKAPVKAPAVSIGLADVRDESAVARYGRQAGAPNNLVKAQSAYLQAARDQPVNWYEWGEEPFRLAQELDLPILLDIGAVWCYWCDVMDAESYSNPAIADLINGYFIPIRVDRDAQPHIDTHYQYAVQYISGDGGWPLTLFLTPEGKAFAGGGYFPAKTRADLAGLSELLPQIATRYGSDRGAIAIDAARVDGQVKATYGELATPGLVNSVLVETISRDMNRRFDQLYGGWDSGTSKFPSGPAVLFALYMYRETGESIWRDMATKTLDSIASGGMRDHVLGGIFRLSEDGKWQIPHFEKMSYVNAEALWSFAQAYEITAKPQYRQAALGILTYLETTGSDQARGGFYASQSSNVSLRDNGSYYTWTLAEAESVLTPEEQRVVIPYFGILEAPTRYVSELPDRNVLYLATTADALAAELGMPVEEVRTLIESGTQRMADARARETAPTVDTAIYTNFNALMISAYLEAARVFERDDLRDFAVKTADYLLDNAYRPGEGMAHAIYHGTPYGEQLFEDQALMASALLDLYEATGTERYLEVTKDLMKSAEAVAWDGELGGYFDFGPKADPLGIIGQQHKTAMDTELPAANPVASITLERLTLTTGDDGYRLASGHTLAAFAGLAENLGGRTATYGLAVHNQVKLAIERQKQRDGG